MEWISVKDKMPEVDKPCLLYQTYPDDTIFNLRADRFKRIFILIGGLRYDSKFISYNDHNSEDGLKHVSHWMPLPKSP